MKFIRYLPIISILLFSDIAFAQHVDTSKYAILTNISEFIYCNFPSSYKMATITEKEVDSVEKILIKCIDKYNITAKLNIPECMEKYKVAPEAYLLRLDRYKRQYIASISPNGDKIIWVNFFCMGDFGNNYWRKEVLFVDDGGNCFFSVKINLTRREYFDLSIN